MKKQMDAKPKDMKPDLKHDNMEFSAATDGDDQLDLDDPAYEEEDITAEELDILEEEDIQGVAEALNSAELDKLADEDTMPEEEWEDDLADNDEKEEEENKEHHRK